MLLTNHLGYELADSKKAVYQGQPADRAGRFIVRSADGREALSGNAAECGPVGRWNTGHYWTLEFTDLREPGTYTIELETADGLVRSFPFELCERLYTMRLLNATTAFFKSQRSSGEWLEADRKLPFQGSKEGMIDLHGGWYDASGDFGIHLSHLSHTAVHNPQQASIVSYAFYKAVDLLYGSGNRQYSMLLRRMLDEAAFGADFIMRLRSPSGSFYRSVDRGGALDSVHGGRFVDYEHFKSSGRFAEGETPVPEEIGDRNYEVGFRSGGGCCIASLAAAARHWYPGADYSTSDYLLAAKDAWAYLWTHNEQQVSDGKWNLLDEYCALLAAVELRRATGEYEYLDRAEQLARRIVDRMVETGEDSAWFESRPGEWFFHAADEGLPIIALLEFLEIEPEAELRKEALQAAERAMRHALAITGKASNPFGYPRFLYRERSGETSERYFFPHDTGAAPWWQGDNARVASLSAAARALALRTEDGALRERLERYASDALDWIMGLNPFDSCMIEGYGRNNIQYFFRGRYDFMNDPGGVCNGITGGLDDDQSIAFVSRPGGEIDDNWRWAEQWLPHNSWLLLANAYKQR